MPPQLYPLRHVGRDQREVLQIMYEVSDWPTYLR